MRTRLKEQQPSQVNCSVVRRPALTIWCGLAVTWGYRENGRSRPVRPDSAAGVDKDYILRVNVTRPPGEGLVVVLLADAPPLDLARDGVAVLGLDGGHAAERAVPLAAVWSGCTSSTRIVGL